MRKSPSCCWSLLLCCVALLLPYGVCGAQQLLVVHADGFFPPNEMVEGEQVRGVHIDLIQAAADKLGVTVVFRSYPWKRAMIMLQRGELRCWRQAVAPLVWKRAMIMLQRGEADAITYMGKTTAREQFGIFVEGNLLSRTHNGFFALKDQASKISYSGDLQTLRGHTIGAIRGRAYFAEFDQAKFLQKDDGALDEGALLKKLITGRVDLAIGSVSRMRYVAQNLNVADKIVFLQPYAPPINNYLVFSKAKNHEQLARRFAGAMEGVKKSGSYPEILKRYYVKAEDF
jgi:polar amino acid transport system substrate-binding protein